MPFPRVDLRIWRTGMALFVATFEDIVSQRFLSDVQRAIDRDLERGELKALPHFQWPPAEHAELANMRSLRSAWRALLQRQHRERPLRLMVLFGEASSCVSVISGPPDTQVQTAGSHPGSAPAAIHAPALGELQSSASAKRALWSSLLDLT